MDLATIPSIITQTLVYATPLISTALGGVFLERSGVVNVGLEGIMVMGAFSSVVFNLTLADTSSAATLWIACLAGGLVGIVLSLSHVIAVTNLWADHTIGSTVINLMAPVLGVFLVKVTYQKGQADMVTQSFGYFSFLGLSKIPVIGELFFVKTSLPAFIATLIAILTWFVICKTCSGLWLRSVGEHPQAADTLGVNVYLIRYSGVLLSSFLGGMGGTVFAQSIAGRFGVTTTAGQGFISMAAMILGRRNPLGAMGAVSFFGLAQNLSIAGEDLPIISETPKVYLQAAPYVLTTLVLVVFFGKPSGPKANGKNYAKTK